MQVTFLNQEMVNSDLGVVNAARVSLHKSSQWDVKFIPEHTNFVNPKGAFVDTLNSADTRLIHYLASQEIPHWTPFAHARLYFSLNFTHLTDMLNFHFDGNMAGMAWQRVSNTKVLYKGSLYSWLNNIRYFNLAQQDALYDIFQGQYPVSSKALLGGSGYQFPVVSGVVPLSEEYIVQQELWHLASCTLLLKVPIFIARQIRTSQVSFAYSDQYVEGEAFVYNEVSRRYVNEPPEFYEINEWRTREGSNVKQGSTGLASIDINHNSSMIQRATNKIVVKYYTCLLERDNIAPEQARALLPQSMMTEMWMTGTLHRWAQWLSLRLDKHVQQETQQLANMVHDTLAEQYPAWQKAYNL